MAAQLEDLERVESVAKLTDEELWRKYNSPEAIEHFKYKYPRECETAA